MKKKSEKLPAFGGLRQERLCRYPKREGRIRWWCCREGAPMGLGPKGEAWALEWIPGGKGKPLFVHFRSRDESSRAFRSLSAGKERDRWGLFEIQTAEPEKSENGSETDPQPPGGEGDARPAIARNAPLTPTLVQEFTSPEIVAVLRDMLQASRPIYASSEGSQQVVGYEPDWNTRREALKMLLHYRDGLPLKRVEEVRHETVSHDQMLQSLMKSPASRNAFRSWIDWCDEQQRKSLANIMKADVKDAEVER
jgi:hypothetical protein